MFYSPIVIWRWLARLRLGAPLLAVALLLGCARPHVHPSPGPQALPRLEHAYAVMADGYRLPLSRWEAPKNPRAVVLALHGLNDYRQSFANLGRYLAGRGITVVAYDQRGFGNTAGHGLWHGSDQLRADLVAMTALLRERYPDVPLYILGESMGGAVAITSGAGAEQHVQGTVLVAPAVWTRDSMPFYQRIALWVAAHTMPARRLTGEGLDLQPSDNIDMLRALARDELVIKATRVDVLYGVSNLMDSAMLAAGTAHGNILFLYGKHDDIIPARPTCELYLRLSNSPATRLSGIIYEKGYHMLTRDLQGETVLQDIAAWIEEQQTSPARQREMQSYCAGQRGGL